MISEQENIPIVLETDSASAIQLLQGIDIPKRSRHIEIRLLWLRSKLETGEVILRHRPGLQNVADLFTKCLSAQDFMRHRLTLGLAPLEGPLEELAVMFSMYSCGSNNTEYLIVEVCCSPDSNICRACVRSNIRYVGISSGMEYKSTLRKTNAIVEEQARLGKWVHVHVSTPCKTGSPLLNFHAEDSEERTAQLEEEWARIMRSVGPYLNLGDSKSFELPKTNRIWKRELTLSTLENHGLVHECVVHLCQTRLCNPRGIPIGKRIRFVSSSAGFCKSLRTRFGSCSCHEHSAMSEINFHRTALYTPTLARAILNAVKDARRDP